MEIDFKTNGSEHAFPHIHICGSTIKVEGGLSKREYFFAEAIKGLLPTANKQENNWGQTVIDGAYELTKMAIKKLQDEGTK